MDVRIVPFCQDVIRAALEEIQDPAVLVFPTRVAAGMARKAFQPLWKFQDFRCVDMDELKNELIPPPGPFLQDEKRLLCLYAALTDEDRDSFHITCYDDMIAWGGQFFRFFGEMCDECVPISKLENNDPEPQMRLLAWQEEYIARILAIRKRYLSDIQALGFGDAIFWMDAQHIRLPQETKRYVFVNQYYYSGLEKALITALEEAGNEILIIHQGSEGSFDPLTLRSTGPSLETMDKSQYRLRRLDFQSSETQDQMILAFLADCGARVDEIRSSEADKVSRLVVDHNFTGKHYAADFSRAVFRFSGAKAFSDTRLHRLLSLRVRHSRAMQATQDGRFLPLAEILNACAVPGFVHSLCPSWDDSHHAMLLREIKYLISKDYLYIDRDLDLLGMVPKPLPHLEALLRGHFATLDDVAGIKDIADIISLTDGKEFWMLRGLCSPEEWEHPDLQTLYYERLANFRSVEELGIVRSWKDVFASDSPLLGASLLKLWLDFLASASLKDIYSAGSEPLWEINSLLDTRNIQYDEVVFLNAVEGVLPSNPEAVWLLNESQRSSLGLKTFELIRDRERYYFLRLILACHSARLCYYYNKDKDIEPGSFVTELMLLLDTNALDGVEARELSYAPSAKVLFDARELIAPPSLGAPAMRDPMLTGIDPADPEAFFSIPCQPDVDFGKDASIKSGSYDLDLLTKNPFAWYLKTRSGLRRETLPPQETLTPKFFGTILHLYLMQILNPLAGKHQGTARLRAVFENTHHLQTLLRDILTSPQYVYCVPQNYNQEFLLGIISDCLVESVQRFYQDFLERHLQRREFELIPEQEEMTAAERPYRLLAHFGPEDLPYSVQIHGKADLRIETPTQNMIVDFKSGGSKDDGQLIFYENFYYLLDPDYDDTPLQSLFWMILDIKEEPGKINDAKRAKWKNDIVFTLQDCLTRGFYIARVAKDRNTFASISRADIYASQHWRNA
jgi:hypothetical protein